MLKNIKNIKYFKNKIKLCQVLLEFLKAWVFLKINLLEHGEFFQFENKIAL